MHDRFNKISRKVNLCLKAGCYADACFYWTEMAEILRKEDKYEDELKVLMLMFDRYFVISGGGICVPAVESARNAVRNANLTKQKQREMYLEISSGSCDKASGISHEERFNTFESCVYSSNYNECDIIYDITYGENE